MAGTLTVTSERIGAIRKWTLDWLSDAAGAVDVAARSYGRGWLRQVKFEPDAAGTQPTTLYDVVLNDEGGEDVLTGTGADLSNTVGKYAVPMIGDGTTTDKLVFLDGQNYDLIVAAAGNAKGGLVYLYVEEM